MKRGRVNSVVAAWCCAGLGLRGVASFVPALSTRFSRSGQHQRHLQQHQQQPRGRGGLGGGSGHMTSRRTNAVGCRSSSSSSSSSSGSFSRKGVSDGRVCSVQGKRSCSMTMETDCSSSFGLDFPVYEEQQQQYYSSCDEQTSGQKESASSDEATPDFQKGVKRLRIEDPPAVALATYPFASPDQDNVYNDSFTDKLWIQLFAKRINAAVGGTEADLPEPITYESYVKLAWKLQEGPPEEQRQVVMAVLGSIFPSFFPTLYRVLFPPTKLSAEINAFMCPPLFAWLVGPSQLIQKEITFPHEPDRPPELWRSTVKVERCRYLEASRCKGACMNLCKVPTQTFFQNVLGMPLEMVPDFDDLSCEFRFGQVAPAVDQDPLLQDPCFKECPATASASASSRRVKPCHTMPEVPSFGLAAPLGPITAPAAPEGALAMVRMPTIPLAPLRWLPLRP